MDGVLAARVQEAKEAAREVLRHNLRGPCRGLPRTAGWGYPEPYTRDLMISALGYLASGDEKLIEGLRRTFLALAQNQTARGHIPSLAHDSHDLGASDTTPLFLLALAIYRRVTGEHDFLEEAARKALTWMEYQSPDDRVIVGQLPTTDWRDEHWVMGFGLYVNALVYAYLQLYDQPERARALKRYATHLTIRDELITRRVEEVGLVVPRRPYYALWSFKLYSNDRFDLLGNCFAILSGFAPLSRARRMVRWIENECEGMRRRRELVGNLPPVLFPFMRPGDSDWRPRYELFALPGDYHNGGLWPFTCGLYIAAVVAAGYPRLAEQKLAALTDLVQPARDHQVAFGFNEWIKAQTGEPRGNDWQTWSAALYLYAAACVEQNTPLFFEQLVPRPLLSRGRSPSPPICYAPSSSGPLT
jgi:hypothetical protein